MLTARLETGEANIGAAMPLRSIAACVIGGVSLRGGTGRLGSVVLGAVFIEWFENGMNLVRIQSYLQMVVLGVLLIFAVVMDEVRHRYVAKSREDEGPMLERVAGIGLGNMRLPSASALPRGRAPWAACRRPRGTAE